MIIGICDQITLKNDPKLIFYHFYEFVRRKSGENEQNNFKAILL